MTPKHVTVSFDTLIEDQPGPQWQAHCDALWPSYRAWFVRSNVNMPRPTFLASRRALREHMPELEPTWQRLVEMAGGGDDAARFLSMWCPPPYIGGCAQAVWIDPQGHEGPALLRNYDFAPLLLEGSWMATRWTGQRVLAVGDCLWGALDGINESGLCAALSFGGRQVSGVGFGIPLVLRYVLEVATNTAEAVAILQRVPVSMCYSVTLLDRQGQWATVFLSPDRAVEVTDRRSVTNLQHGVEWPQHARATHAVERAAALADLVAGPVDLTRATAALFEPPLYQTSYHHRHGTLYSAVYRPQQGQVDLLWPGQRWAQSLAAFEPGQRLVLYPLADAGMPAMPQGANSARFDGRRAPGAVFST